MDQNAQKIEYDKRDPWDLNELLAADWLVPPPGLLGDKMLRHGSVCLLAGETGIGKTHLGIKLADSISSGSRFAGLQAKKANVLFISEEMTAEEMRERLNEFHRTGDANIQFLFQQGINLAQWKGMSQLKDLIVRADKPELVIIDALNDIYFGASEAMGSMMRGLRDQIARPMNCCVLLIHHFIKPTEFTSGIHQIQGPKTLINVAANVLLCEGSKDKDKPYYKTLTFAKVRHRSAPGPVEFAMYERADGKLDIVFTRDGDDV